MNADRPRVGRLSGLAACAFVLLLADPAAASVTARGNVFIHEMQISTAGTDWEFVELLGRPGQSLNHLTLLGIEGDAGSPQGRIDLVLPLEGEVIGADGYWTAGSPAAESNYGVTFDLSIGDNSFENGTSTYLLVANFTGSQGDDLDSDDNGTLDSTPWAVLVDSLGFTDGGAGDRVYSSNVAGPDGSFLPSGTYRCDGSFGSNLLTFGTPDGTPSAANSQCPAPAVYLNELSVSTTGVDWEYFEVSAWPGTDLGMVTLLSIESDTGASAGRIDALMQLAGPAPGDAQWVAMTAEAVAAYEVDGDAQFNTNFFENSTTTNLLVTGFSGTVGSDIDADNDGTMDTTFWSSLLDGVAVIDSLTDFAYAGVPTVGPDGSFLPAGAYRCMNAPNGAFMDFSLLDFSNPDGTPGVFNPCLGSDAPPQVSRATPGDGASGVALDAMITLEFNEPVNIAGEFARLDCPSYGAPQTFTEVLSGVRSVTLDPADFGVDESCVLTVFWELVVDADNNWLDGEGTGLTGDFVLVFATSSTAGVGVCGDPAALISAVQGSGAASPILGDAVVVEGVVVGDYQETTTTNPARPELRGFYLQEEDTDADGDTATSEGIFVFDPDKTMELNEGDRVRVAGTVGEFAGNTQLGGLAGLLLCDTGQSVTPAIIDLPVPPAFATLDEYYERFEGMSVSFADSLTASEQFELARYGQLLLAEGGRLRQYGQDGSLPLSQAGLDAWADANARRSIKLDDFNTQQNIDPVFHPQPGGFAVDNYIRLGATVANLQGVLNYTFGEWTVQPHKTTPVAFSNPLRPPVSIPSGNVVVGSMNVLNYFNGDGLGGGFPTARGADSAAELQRQTDKLVAAIAGLDADVLGLIEIENDGDGASDALAQLVDAVNAVAGAGTYDYVQAGLSGGADEIKTSLIYKPAIVTPVGESQLLASTAFTDPNNSGGQLNRPALAQTFRVSDAGNPDFGGAFTVVVLHLKSQGSACGAGDDDPVQGNCNDTRTKAAAELLNWLAGDPTDTLGQLGAVDPDVLIVGDFNSYFQQDPMQVFYGAGYSNLLPQAGYSYVFSGELGSLDHMLASPSLATQLGGSAVWHINSDENSLLDYNDTVQDASEASFEAKPPTNPLYAADAFRSSDHDPVLGGLDLVDAPAVSATEPSNAAVDVPLGANITITFDRAVAASTASFSIACDETGGHSFALSGGPAEWILDPDADFGLSETCTVTVLASAVSEPSGGTPMLEDYVFSFATAAESAAVIRVSKDFDDGNPAAVTVYLSCNTGLPLNQQKTITEAGGVNFVVTTFQPGALDCSVVEEAVAGYASSYQTDQGVSAEGCVFSGIMTTTEQNCVVRNALQAVTFTVTKEWIETRPGSGPLTAEADYRCVNRAQIDPAPAPGIDIGPDGELHFEGAIDSETFSVLPRWDGSTRCSVTEQIVDASVESDDGECQNVPVTVGQAGAGCTIVNTRFFEGIPTLDRAGLMLLALMMLGVGLLGLRRYGG